MLLLLLLCLLVAAPWAPVSGVATAEERPVVRVEQGAVRGVSLRSASGRPFYGFRGVPYARPPVGKRRFKEPEPPKPWPGVWDGTHYGSPCVQYVFTHGPNETRVVGEEDCLHLNIFTPKLPTPNGGSPLLDVFVFIHGGGFMSGSGRYFGPDYLLDHEVIVVTINYRLGILGCVGDRLCGVSKNLIKKDRFLLPLEQCQFGSKVIQWGLLPQRTARADHYCSAADGWQLEELLQDLAGDYLKHCC